MRKEHSGSREWQGKDTMLVSNELGGSGQKEGCGLERDETRSELGPGREGPCGPDEGFGF